MGDSERGRNRNRDRKVERAALMVNRYLIDGVLVVEIHCGCCGMFFKVLVGGSCFCQACIDGHHVGCAVKYIMGVAS